MKYAIEVDDREVATILAALRFYQAGRQFDASARMEAIDDIATNGGDVDALDAEEIDELCERINTGVNE